MKQAKKGKRKTKSQKQKIKGPQIVQYKMGALSVCETDKALFVYRLTKTHGLSLLLLQFCYKW